MVELQPSKLQTEIVTSFGTATSSDGLLTHSSNHSTSSENDDLQQLVDAWQTLPAPIKVAILAMVKATGKPMEGTA